MPIIINTVFILAGLCLLYFGGLFLVRGASAIALKFHIPSLVVGLTVVAFGTSTPELFTSIISALRGHSEISLGNIVGSNIINIALILGLSAIIAPITIDKMIISRDIPFMFISYALLFVTIYPVEMNVSAIGRISRIEGLLMLAVLSINVLFLYQSTKGKDTTKKHNDDMELKDLKRSFVQLILRFILLGILALVFGSELLTRGASWMARNVFMASDRFIGITIVALGTSLPELMTSLIAAARKQMNLSVGNVVGSNVFNSLLVAGLTSLFVPIEITSQGFNIDILVMCAVSGLLFVVVILRKKLERWTGFLLLLCYIFYTVYLFYTRIH